MHSIDEAQVQEAERRLRAAQLLSDVAELDALIAPDLLFATHTGHLASKADDLEQHRQRVLKLERSEALAEEIRIHEGFAVVSVVMHLVGTFAGEPVDQQLRYNRVWAPNHAGALQLVAGSMAMVQ